MCISGLLKSYEMKLFICSLLWVDSFSYSWIVVGWEYCLVQMRWQRVPNDWCRNRKTSTADLCLSRRFEEVAMICWGKACLNRNVCQSLSVRLEVAAKMAVTMDQIVCKVYRRVGGRGAAPLTTDTIKVAACWWKMVQIVSDMMDNILSVL